MFGGKVGELMNDGFIKVNQNINMCLSVLYVNNLFFLTILSASYIDGICSYTAKDDRIHKTVPLRHKCTVPTHQPFPVNLACQLRLPQ